MLAERMRHSPTFDIGCYAEFGITTRSFLRYAWPVCFLLSGLFLLVFSDTELWPLLMIVLGVLLVLYHE